MSKVKKEIVEAAVMKLVQNVTQTMPTTVHKFMLGGAAALVALNGGSLAEKAFGQITDSEGYVDMDTVNTVINGGFEASGGKIQLDLFQQNGGMLSMFVKPITLTITKEDIKSLMDEIEQNSVKEVKLQTALQAESK